MRLTLNVGYLRIAATALGLTACVLLVALWVRSYGWTDDAYCPLPSSNVLIVNSWRGRLSTYAGERGKYPSGWGTKSHYIANIVGRNHSRRNWGYASDEQGREVMVPVWVPIIISAALAATLNIRLPWRFSLRTLLIATTLVAVGMGVVLAAT